MADDFIRTLDRINRVTQRLPLRAATVAVNFSKERFRQKNWVDTSRKPWPKRKRETRGSTLVQSGRLKRSIRKIAASKTWILIGTDVPYAQIHNEGGSIKKTVQVKEHTRKRGRRTSRKRKTDRSLGPIRVRAHSRKMNLEIKQRRFLGNSSILARRIERLIEKDIKKALL